MFDMSAWKGGWLLRSMADSTWKTNVINDETSVCRKLDFTCCGSGIIRYCKKLMRWSRLSGRLYTTRWLHPIPTPTLPLKGREIALCKPMRPDDPLQSHRAKNINAVDGGLSRFHGIKYSTSLERRKLVLTHINHKVFLY